MDSFTFPTALAHLPTFSLSLDLIAGGSGAASRKEAAGTASPSLLPRIRPRLHPTASVSSLSTALAGFKGGLSTAAGLKGANPVPRSSTDSRTWSRAHHFPVAPHRK